MNTLKFKNSESSDGIGSLIGNIINNYKGDVSQDKYGKESHAGSIQVQFRRCYLHSDGVEHELRYIR